MSLAEERLDRIVNVFLRVHPAGQQFNSPPTRQPQRFNRYLHRHELLCQKDVVLAQFVNDPNPVGHVILVQLDLTIDLPYFE